MGEVLVCLAACLLLFRSFGKTEGIEAAGGTDGGANRLAPCARDKQPCRRVSAAPLRLSTFSRRFGWWLPGCSGCGWGGVPGGGCWVGVVGFGGLVWFVRGADVGGGGTGVLEGGFGWGTCWGAPPYIRLIVVWLPLLLPRQIARQRRYSRPIIFFAARYSKLPRRLHRVGVGGLCCHEVDEEDARRFTTSLARPRLMGRFCRERADPHPPPVSRTNRPRHPQTLLLDGSGALYGSRDPKRQLAWRTTRHPSATGTLSAITRRLWVAARCSKLFVPPGRE
jgi:hypothetical protein